MNSLNTFRNALKTSDRPAADAPGTLRLTGDEVLYLIESIAADEVSANDGLLLRLADFYRAVQTEQSTGAVECR